MDGLVSPGSHSLTWEKVIFFGRCSPMPCGIRKAKHNPFANNYLSSVRCPDGQFLPQKDERQNDGTAIIGSC
jgi:hypothetical protein